MQQLLIHPSANISYAHVIIRTLISTTAAAVKYCAFI